VLCLLVFRLCLPVVVGVKATVSLQVSVRRVAYQV
jgi:hypothetical protein